MLNLVESIVTLRLLKVKKNQFIIMMQDIYIYIYTRENKSEIAIAQAAFNKNAYIYGSN
jgi:hypothetical protein